MPIEIKELYIKAVVSNTPISAANQPANIDLTKLKKELMKECVQEVLKTLQEKNER